MIVHIVLYDNEIYGVYYRYEDAFNYIKDSIKDNKELSIEMFRVIDRVII